MLDFRTKLAVACLLFALTNGPVAERLGAAPKTETTPTGGHPYRLPVGWHDEFTASATTDREWWAAAAPPHDAVLSFHGGSLGLLMPHVPDGFPDTFQWGEARRSVVVDLDRYPVLVARVPVLSAGAYSQVILDERDYSGRVVRSPRTAGMNRTGLLVLDAGRGLPGGVRRLTLRLIVGGPLTGASGAFSYVRFIRREDLPFVRSHQDWQTVRPSGMERDEY